MKTTTTLMAAIVACVLSAPTANACSCAFSTVEQQFDSSQRVFTGTVLETEVPEGEEEVRRATFQVQSIWKGDRSTRIFVDTIPVATCNLVLQVGAEYLVYATTGSKDGIYLTHECFRTRRVDLAADDLARLGEPLFSVPLPASSLGMIKVRY